MESHSMTSPKDRAFENYEATKKLKEGLRSNYLGLAKLLHECCEGRLYEDLDYETFESYIASPELGFERRTVYSLISIYERFILEYHVQPAALLETEYTKLAEVLPVTTADNYEEWLSKSVSLSRNDLRDEIRQFRGLPERQDVKPVGLILEDLIQKVLDSNSKRTTFEHSGQKFTLSLVQKKVASENGHLINELIELFSPINRSYKLMYKQSGQRSALERLIQEHTFDWVKELLKALPGITTQKYAPRVTTPLQLESKLGDLQVFIQQTKGANGTRTAKIR